MKSIVKILLLLLLFTLTYHSSIGQITKNIIEHEGITNSTHKNHIGEITFLASSIPIEETKESNFLNTIELTAKTNLYIRTYMGNSLTNYLHFLEPDIPIDSLTRYGRFQFSFFVDSILIYKENLHYGAFGAENKNMRTVFRVPLVSVKKEDSWGRFLWGRFMENGGENALRNEEHLLTIEIRPYIDFKTPKTGDLISKGSIRVMTRRSKKKIEGSKIDLQKIKPNKDWEISNAAVDKEKIKALNLKIAENSFKDITSIVVIKDGKLLLEEYFNGTNRKTLHDTRSVGKSFTNALLGIAIKDGYIENINQTLSNFYDLNKYQNNDPKKAAITLEQLLTMSAGFEGFDFDEKSIGNEEYMYPKANWVNWALNLPMTTNRKPGDSWAYFTAGVVVLGDILNSKVPNELEKYAKEKLFDPLNIKKYKWQYTPQKVVNTAGGLRLSSLDLAKFGQLYQNNGTWKEKEILPISWVKESLTKHYDTSIENLGYGYLFWNQTYVVNEIKHEVSYCSGNGGNKIYIFKNQPIVVVITAKAYNTMYMHSQVDKIMQNYIIPAITN